MGFREAAFTIGVEYLFQWDLKIIFELLTFIILFIIHFCGVLAFFYHFKKRDIRLWCFLAYFFPSMLFVSHMRYFMPMIPIALIGFAFMVEYYIIKYKEKN